jgi:hypothetical protein
MTNEPDKSGRVRQSVTAALLAALLLLSALAFVAGCKSSPPPLEPKTGYLYSYDDSVIFIKWEQTGQKLKGFILVYYEEPAATVAEEFITRRIARTTTGSRTATAYIYGSPKISI